MSYSVIAELRSESISTRRAFVDAIEELTDRATVLEGSVRDYEKIIQARDKFGCWLCAKHQHEEFDENIFEEKEVLREENLALRLQIKAFGKYASSPTSTLLPGVSSLRASRKFSEYSLDESSPARFPAQHSRSPSTVVKRVTVNAPVSPVGVRKSSSVKPIILNQVEPNLVARKMRQKRAAFSPGRIVPGSITYDRKRKVLLSHPLFASLKEPGVLEIIANSISIQLNHNETIVKKIPANASFLVIDGVVKVGTNDDVKTLTVGDVYNPHSLVNTDEPISVSQISLSSYTVHAEVLVITRELFAKCVGPVSISMQQYLEKVKTKLDLSDLTIGRTIGRGGTSVVKLAYSKGEVFALKIIKKSLLRNTKGDLLKNEKLILEELNGSNFVIKLKQTLKDAVNIYILLELAPGGDLLSVISSLGILTRAQTQFYIGCMVLGIAYCHEHGIVYRDLKVENFLVDALGYVKLADFGIAKKMNPDGRTFSLVGTPQFMAPEIVLGKGYAFAADLWALGCCMYELLVGELLFDVAGNEDSANQFELFERILKFNPETDIEWPDSVDLPSRALIFALLKQNPSERPTIDEIKAHAFFSETSFDWEKLENRQLTPPFVPHLAPIASRRSSGLNTEATPSEVGTDDIPSASPALSSASCASFDRSSIGYRESAGSWDFNI